MEYKIPLWQHQKEALKRASDLHNFALLLDPGTGKTATTINIIRQKCNEKKRLLRTLVLSPIIVVDNWRKEFFMHSDIKPSQITCLTGTGKNRLKLFNERKHPSHIFCCNYESLNMEDLYKALVDWQPEIVVMDEAHRCRNYASKRAKLADKLINGRMGKDGTGPRPHVYILSGSPVLNSPLDLYMQFKLLDGGETFGSNFFGFRAKYFRDANARMPKHVHFPNWQIIPGAMDEMAKKIAPISMRVLKHECLDLPEFVRQTITVEMEPDQRKMYDSMLKDFVAFFEQNGKEHVASATLAITKGLRLLQIASGFVKVDGDQEFNVSVGFNAKQKALEEILEDILIGGHKVIIWSVWKQNYQQIRDVLKKLKVRHCELIGDMKQADRENSVAVFNEIGSGIDVLIGNPASSGLGVNLTGASYSVYYSRNFSLENEIQSEARNYRGGSAELHDKVTRVDIVTANSIEVQVADALSRKESIGVELLKEITKKL